MSVGLKAKEQAQLPFNLFVLMSPKSLFELWRKVCFQATPNCVGWHHPLKSKEPQILKQQPLHISSWDCFWNHIFPSAQTSRLMIPGLEIMVLPTSITIPLTSPIPLSQINTGRKEFHCWNPSSPSWQQGPYLKTCTVESNQHLLPINRDLRCHQSFLPLKALLIKI